nr:MAG TPA: hypothetical protein [Caudoviricetes sp.]
MLFTLRSEKRINTSTVYSEQHTSSIYPSNPEMSRINSQKGATNTWGKLPQKPKVYEQYIIQ